MWKKKARESPRLLKNSTSEESLMTKGEKERKEDEGKHDPKIMGLVGAIE